jgi:rSAM/selenodomain-associated transferase 2
MICVVIPTLNAQTGLAATLTSLVPAAVEGLVRQVVVVDAGSSDRSVEIAEQAGAEIIRSSPGRGTQLASGAERGRFPWLLFLHADTILQPGWEREVTAFIERVEEGPQEAAAAFRFALDDRGVRPRLLETMVALRCAVLRLPYGDQGLLISRRLYNRLGGYAPIPLMEDVDLMRRLRRDQIFILRSQALTSAVRYRRDGYAWRSLRNLLCLTLYYARVPTRILERLYG